MQTANENTASKLGMLYSEPDVENPALQLLNAVQWR